MVNLELVNVLKILILGVVVAEIYLRAWSRILEAIRRVLAPASGENFSPILASLEFRSIKTRPIN
jgi:uncharacterized protein YggT (Ycf19 family)